jgi:hypothetical protein
MTQAPIQSRRSVTRFLIAAAVVIALAGWWLQTSRIDPRLVGFWSIANGTGRTMTWVLDAGGKCRHVDHRQRETLVVPWRVDGGTVTFGRGPLWASGMMEDANSFLGWAVRWRPFLPPIELDVVSVDEQTFVLRHSGGMQMTFTRIPEFAVLPSPLEDRDRVLLAVCIVAFSGLAMAWNARRRRKRESLETATAVSDSPP